MMCFEDRTFCTYYETCTHGDVCSKALTAVVKEQAAEWARSFLLNGEQKDKLVIPIMIFTDKPDCYAEIVS